MSTIISLAMAEIASAYPTAGGLYYWASKLGSPGLGLGDGLVQPDRPGRRHGRDRLRPRDSSGPALLDYWFGYFQQMNDSSAPRATRRTTCSTRSSCSAPALINLFNIRITAGLNTISAYWHMIGVAFIVIVLIIVPDNHQSLSYVFTETVNNSGYGGGTTSLSSPTFWFVWGLGLLLAQYTITGFDASAHTAEETQHASRMAATGMWTSVVASVIFGWILLLAVTFAIPSTQFALDNIGTVVPSIWAESMSQSWAEALLFICVVAQFFCLTASVTSASRMMFAFSRDRAVPGHSLWRRVGAEPHSALVGRRHRRLRGRPHDPRRLELPRRLLRGGRPSR